jgi:hypothetical protein
MKAAAIVFAAAASIAAGLVFGFVSLGGSRKSLTPIELRGFDQAVQPRSSRGRGGAFPLRTMVPQHVDERAFAGLRTRIMTRAAR